MRLCISLYLKITQNTGFLDDAKGIMKTFIQKQKIQLKPLKQYRCLCGKRDWSTNPLVTNYFLNVFAVPNFHPFLMYHHIRITSLLFISIYVGWTHQAFQHLMIQIWPCSFRASWYTTPVLLLLVQTPNITHQATNWGPMWVAGAAHVFFVVVQK